MKRGRKAKSSFYHIRFNTVGLNEERAAEVLGCSIEEIKQFDTDGAPVMAEQLLLLWDRKHIGIEGWDGWLFSRGVLRYKNRRWTAKRILELSDQEQQLHTLRNELERLRTWRGLFTVFVDKVVMKTARRQRKSRF